MNDNNANVSQDTLDDILATAFDSAITHWCRSVQYTSGEPTEDYLYAPDSFTIELKDAEDGVTFSRKREEFPTYRPLTEATLREGIEMAAAEHDIDLDDMDATAVDQIVQYAAFGEIVFG